MVELFFAYKWLKWLSQTLHPLPLTVCDTVLFLKSTRLNIPDNMYSWIELFFETTLTLLDLIMMSQHSD